MIHRIIAAITLRKVTTRAMTMSRLHLTVDYDLLILFNQTYEITKTKGNHFFGICTSDAAESIKHWITEYKMTQYAVDMSLETKECFAFGIEACHNFWFFHQEL